MHAMLEMTYFRDELVQLIVSRSDSDLEVQRYGMKKNMLTVDPIMLQDELWMRQREKPSPNRRCQFSENWTAETEFSVFELWGRFGSVFRKMIFKIFIRFRTPLARNPNMVSRSNTHICQSSHCIHFHCMHYNFNRTKYFNYWAFKSTNSMQFTCMSISLLIYIKYQHILCNIYTTVQVLCKKTLWNLLPGVQKQHNKSTVNTTSAQTIYIHTYRFHGSCIWSCTRNWCSCC